MIIKVLSTQVPSFWEAIKMTVKQADEVDDKDLQPYLNELLHALLNDTAQCWVRLDENRTLIALCVTRVQVDKVTGDRYLYMQSLYSWQKQDENIWKRDRDFIGEFAKKEGCKYLTFNSRNEAMFNIADILGFKERTRIFELRID